MTILLLLAGVAILPGEVVPAEAADLSAGEVIAKSEAAYAATKTYIGTTKVRTKSDNGVGLRESVATAKVTFMRPGKILIEGRTASPDLTSNGRDSFTIVSDGVKTWRSWAIRNNGAFQEVKNVPMAGMGGVAHGAPEGIPAALMKSDGVWVGGNDPFIVPRLSETKVEGHEKIDGADCYKLVAKHPRLGNATMWIDSNSFFLRQMMREHNETQLADSAKTAAEAFKRMGKEPPNRSSPLKSMTNVFSFEIYQVDTAVDQQLFYDPTKK